MAGAQSEVLTPADLVELIAAVAKGDEAAFDRLYAATRAKLYGVVLRILRRAHLAAAGVQGADLRIWGRARGLHPSRATPTTSVGRISRNPALRPVGKKGRS